MEKTLEKMFLIFSTRKFFSKTSKTVWKKRKKRKNLKKYFSIVIYSYIVRMIMLEKTEKNTASCRMKKWKNKKCKNQKTHIQYILIFVQVIQTSIILLKCKLLTLEQALNFSTWTFKVWKMVQGRCISNYYDYTLNNLNG